MQCSKHPEHQADGSCAFSGRPYCAAELVEVDARLYARDNLGRVLEAARQASAAAAPVTIVNSASAAASAGVVVVQRKKTSFLMNLFLTFITGGLWLPIWLYRSC